MTAHPVRIRCISVVYLLCVATPRLINDSNYSKFVFKVIINDSNEFLFEVLINDSNYSKFLFEVIINDSNETEIIHLGEKW